MADTLSTVLTQGAFGLGCAPLGNLYRAMSDAAAEELLNAAWNAGVRWFDTAPHYGLGLSERRLGAFLRGKPRDEFVVSTKVGRRLIATPENIWEQDDEGFEVPASYRRAWDFSAAGVAETLEQSLDRLELDRIDVVLLHDPSEHLDQATHEAAPALHQLKREGLVSAVGAGTRDLDALAFLVREAPLDVVMAAGRYTLLDQEATQQLFPICRSLGVPVLNVGLFNSGILATSNPSQDSRFEYTTADSALVARAQAIAALCVRHGTTLPAAAFHFGKTNPAVAAVAIGAASVNELVDDVALSNSAPPVGLWYDLAREGHIDNTLLSALDPAG